MEQCQPFNFWNSTLLQTIVTAIVGFAALAVYKWQKNDQLRSAATMLLLEIRQAERAVQRAREYIRQGDINVDLHILRSDTWDNNKHLFVKKLDRDEWDAITDFYDKARLLDGAIQYAQESFKENVAQIRNNRQRIFADITKDTIDQLAQARTDEEQRDIMGATQAKIDISNGLYGERQAQAVYNPQKNLDDAKKCVEDFSNISTTSVGQKLKRISRNKKL